MTRVCGTTTPLTKQRFSMEMIGLSLTDITWLKTINFSLLSMLPLLISFCIFFSIIQNNTWYVFPSRNPFFFDVMWVRSSMINLLFFAFKIFVLRSSWYGGIGKSNYCIKIIFSNKFALRALLPIETPRWRNHFLKSWTSCFCNSSSVILQFFITKELKEYIATFKHSHFFSAGEKFFDQWLCYNIFRKTVNKFCGCIGKKVYWNSNFKVCLEFKLWRMFWNYFRVSGIWRKLISILALNEVCQGFRVTIWPQW